MYASTATPTAWQQLPRRTARISSYSTSAEQQSIRLATLLRIAWTFAWCLTYTAICLVLKFAMLMLVALVIVPVLMIAAVGGMGFVLGTCSMRLQGLTSPARPLISKHEFSID